ncbi:MAG: lactate utilization protein [Microscillaceae bacterium]|nr:lactate utilization protein [Microscillaceae bacterium]
MSVSENHFSQKSQEWSTSFRLRQHLQASWQPHIQQQNLALNQFQDWELAQSRAAYLRAETLQNLAQQLETFETNFKKQGGDLLWASNAEAAQAHLRQLIRRYGLDTLAYSQALILLEINLPEWEGSLALSPTGQPKGQALLPAWLAQLAPPLPEETLEDPPPHTGAAIPSVLRVTSADFMVADTGVLVMIDADGTHTALLSQSQPLVVVMGLEQVLARLEDVELMASIKHIHREAKPHFAQLLLAGPAPTSPLHLILLDNGRSQLWRHPYLHEALQCIGCGACSRACPLVPLTAASDQGLYPGPIGAILNPFLAKARVAKPSLIDTSPLCGACSSACPVGIDLQNLLHQQRVHRPRPFWQKVKTWWPFRNRLPFLKAVQKFAAVQGAVRKR